MPKLPEQYQPSPEEIKKAEETMTPARRGLSSLRPDPEHGWAKAGEKIYSWEQEQIQNLLDGKHIDWWHPPRSPIVFTDGPNFEADGSGLRVLFDVCKSPSDLARKYPERAQEIFEALVSRKNNETEVMLFAKDHPEFIDQAQDFAVKNGVFGVGVLWRYLCVIWMTQQ